MKKIVISMIVPLMFILLSCGCAQQQAASGGNQNAGMGRYVEETLPLPAVAGKEEYPVLPFTVGVCLDGSLKMAAVSNKDIYFFSSEDHGETWRPLEQMKEAYYEMQYPYAGDMVWTPDGSILLGSYQQSGQEMIPVCNKIDPSGNVSVITLKLPEFDDLGKSSMSVNNIPVKENELSLFQCDDAGDIYGIDRNRKLMKFSGTTGELLIDFYTYNAGVNRFHLAGNILVAEPGDRFWWYDKDSGEPFDKQEPIHSMLIGGDAYSMYDMVFAGGTQENEILFYSNGNIYRYIMDGNALELVVDGTYNSLSAPDLEIYWMDAVSDEEIIVLCRTNNQYQLKRFVYRPDVPTVPEKELRVYTLEKNDFVEQAVSIFRKNNPDIYVSLEIGIPDKDTTRERAILNLAERLETGGGPDVLFLDGMEGESSIYDYLEDIHRSISSINEETPLFENLLTGDKSASVYAVPTRVQVWICAGRTVAADNGETFDALSAFAKNPEISESYVIPSVSYEALLTKLYGIFGNEIFDEAGDIQEDRLTKFLQGCNAVMHSDHIQVSTSYNWEEDETLKDRISNGLNGLLSDKLIFTYVRLGSAQQFSGAVSLKNQLYPEMDYCFVQNGIEPAGHVAVNKNSGKQDSAELFVKAMLSVEIQQIDIGGFPVVVSAYDKLSENLNISGFYGFGGLMNGEQVMVHVKWADEEDIGLLKENIQTADIPPAVINFYSKPESAAGRQRLLSLMLENLPDIRHRDFDVGACVKKLIQEIEILSPTDQEPQK